MTRLSKVLIGLIGLITATTTVVTTAHAEPTKAFVICYPGGTVNARDAQPATDQMLVLLEKLGQWPEGSFTSHFASSVSKCEDLLAKNPEFALINLSWLLAHSNAPFVPLVQPKVGGKTTETFRVLVKKGAVKTLADLKGKSLVGTPFEDKPFIEKVVLKGKFPLADFNVSASKRPLSALRDLNGGKVAGVMVTEQQYKALGALDFKDQLEVVFTSDPIALNPMVGNTKNTNADERKRFAGAMTNFCSHKDGKPFCELFGIDGFITVDTKALEQVKTLWK